MLVRLTAVNPEPLVSRPRDQETTGSGDENGVCLSRSVRVLTETE